MRREEREAIVASPLDPQVEYVPVALVAGRGCRCPYTVLDDGPRSWQLKVLHRRGCTERVSPDSLPRARRPAGVHPCPDCGNVVHSLVPLEWVGEPGWRRCDGPNGCGRGWRPEAAGQGQRETRVA